MIIVDTDDLRGSASSEEWWQLPLYNTIPGLIGPVLIYWGLSARANTVQSFNPLLWITALLVGAAGVAIGIAAITYSWKKIYAFIRKSP